MALGIPARNRAIDELKPGERSSGDFPVGSTVSHGYRLGGPDGETAFFLVDVPKDSDETHRRTISAGIDALLEIQTEFAI
jgi:hypothetical protein